MATILMLTMANVALGETFKKSELEGSRLYSYDKFSKAWKISAEYSIASSGVQIQIIVYLAQAYIDPGMGPDMRVIFYDGKGEHYNEVNKL